MRGRPFYFGGNRSPLFGWHHPAAPGTGRRMGVVACPAIGFDYMCLYRAWRLTAERLADAGFEVIRIDYFGTGNSAGEAKDPDQVARWFETIELATRELRNRGGVESFSLLGCRLGGTLAATVAATHGGYENLVLWAPYRTGKAYLREARALTSLTGTSQSADPEEALESAGFLHTRSTETGLGEIDLLTLHAPPARDVLIVSRDDRSENPALARHFEGLGSRVTAIAPPGTAKALVEPMTSQLPVGVIERIVAWLVDRGAPEGPGPPWAAAAAPSTGAAGGSEAAFYFGDQDRLFGILTRPAAPAAAEPAVIFLNTGCEPHVGPHRMYVPLARALARRGHVTFRYDLGGIGESRPPAGAPENVAYPAHAMDDLREAVTAVRARTGAVRILLVGICAGGWHAFRAARDGVAVDGFVAVNPPLYLREGPQYTRAELWEQRELRRYVSALSDGAKWRKALAGRSSVRTFARLATVGAWRRFRAAVSKLGVDLRRNGLGADIRTIAKRKIPARFIFAEADLTFTYFKLHAEGQVGRSRGLMDWTIVDHADHTFRPTKARHELEELIERFVTARAEALGARQ